MEAPTPASITSPVRREGADRSLVSRLQQSQVFRDYRAAFETTTGLPLTLRAAGSFQTPLEGSARKNGFCALMAAGNKTCAACLQMQQCAEERARDGEATVQCFAGLSESVVPIRQGGHVLGYLQTGQVFLQPPTAAGFRRTTSRLAELGMKVESAALKKAFFETRVLPRLNYESAVRLLAIFAKHLGEISNQIAVQETCAESPAVARARAFIAEHQTEQVTLRMVAQHVNMSAYYFCKVFHKETGLTFTDYLARRRVEHVKQMLLNPHMRVSEAAYAAGFQSLSQFNRVFNRLAGEAPSAYREKLHGPRAAAPLGGLRPIRHAA